MTRQTATAKNGTEAFKMIHDFLGKEISFSNVSEGYNREDIFTFTAGEGIFISATCTPGNSRIEAIEILNISESGSARHPLTVYINADAEIEQAAQNVTTVEKVLVTICANVTVGDSTLYYSTDIEQEIFDEICNELDEISEGNFKADPEFGITVTVTAGSYAEDYILDLLDGYNINYDRRIFKREVAINPDPELPTLDELNDTRTDFDTVEHVEKAFFDLIGIEETAETTEEGNEMRGFKVNGESVFYFNGELNWIWSNKYRAGFDGYRNQYVVEVPDGRWKKFKRLDVDEFFQIMSERGALFASFETADLPEKYFNEPKTFWNKFNVWRTSSALPFIDWLRKGDSFTAITEQCARINKAAPGHWRIRHDENQFNIEYGGQSVATLDSIALAKVLPSEIFEQFKPLVDKDFDADKEFISDRQQEINRLIEFREELADDPERLKIVDELIRQNKRDIIHTELAV